MPARVLDMAVNRKIRIALGLVATLGALAGTVEAGHSPNGMMPLAGLSPNGMRPLALISPNGMRALAVIMPNGMGPLTMIMPNGVSLAASLDFTTISHRGLGK
jgi:hypothetical protein